jgi:hypothetical protein
MANVFFWLKIGIEHIASIDALDHILFLLAICCIFQVNQWKNILWIITAFTIGHSISLALSAVKIWNVKSELVEFLIPLTIAITCVQNLYLENKKTPNSQNNLGQILLVTFFGLVHGLGFSGLLKQMLGNENDVILPLLSFNIGIEIGQLFIVLMLLLFSYVLVNLLKVKHILYKNSISVLVLIFALFICFERI